LDYVSTFLVSLPHQSTFRYDSPVKNWTASLKEYLS
jgi:hypothetical protein